MGVLALITKKVEKVITEILQLYPSIDDEIQDIEELEFTVNRDINSNIKSKGKINRIVEDEAVFNIISEGNINELLKWKKLVEGVINEYKNIDMEKYMFMKYEFFQKKSRSAIYMTMCISNARQKKLSLEIIYHVAMLGLNEGLLRI